MVWSGGTEMTHVVIFDLIPQCQQWSERATPG